MKEVKLNDMDLVVGGGLFSSHRDSEYESAGVEIVGKGWLYNDGYRFNGKNITSDEAHYIVMVYQWFGYRPRSVAEAKEMYDDFCNSHPM